MRSSHRLRLLLAFAGLAALAACEEQPRRKPVVDDTEELAERAERRQRASASAAALASTPASAGAGGGASATPMAPAVGPPYTAIGPHNVKLVSERWSVDIGDWGKAVAISHALGRVVATAGDELQLLDRVTGARVAAAAPPCEGVVPGGLGWGPSALIVVCAHGIELVHHDTLAKVKGLRVRGAAATAAAIVWPYAALAHDDGVLALYQLDGTSLQEIEVPGPPVAVARMMLSADTSTVAVSFEQGSLWAWQWSKPADPIKLTRNDRSGRSLAMSADGRTLVEDGPSFGINLWNLSSSATPTKRTLELRESWTNGLAVSNGATLVIAGSSGGYSALLPGASGDGAVHPFGGSRDSIEALAVDEVWSSFAGVDRSGMVRLFSLPPP